MGATKWERTGQDTVIGHHQIRAAHVRYTGSDLQRVDRRGHSHASNQHYYRRIDGVWKFAGLKPTGTFCFYASLFTASTAFEISC